MGGIRRNEGREKNLERKGSCAVGNSTRAFGPLPEDQFSTYARIDGISTGYSGSGGTDVSLYKDDVGRFNFRIGWTGDDIVRRPFSSSSLSRLSRALPPPPSPLKPSTNKISENKKKCDIG